MRTREIAIATLFAMFGAHAQAAPSYSAEKRTILGLRADHNRAIARRDLEGAMRIVADDFVLVDGSSGIERSKEEDRKGWAEEFAMPGYKRYVRTPVQVDVGERKGVLRAAELGRWEGVIQKPAGESRPFGRYFAHWTKATGQWKVVSETYVTLGCRGKGC